MDAIVCHKLVGNHCNLALESLLSRHRRTKWESKVKINGPKAVSNSDRTRDSFHNDPDNISVSLEEEKKLKNEEKEKLAEQRKRAKR
jgi:hypothetical protein